MDRTEYGPSGPTQLKDMDAEGTGFSPETAAFIGAHCSPFTNPRDLPTDPRVPDPRNTQQTETMFIWGHFDIPVDGFGDQIILTSADPLAMTPIQWSKSTGTNQNTVNYGPNSYARDLEVAGLSQMTGQMRALGRRSKNYRIVGHGLKVWVSQNSTVSRGNIEAGQFTVDGTIAQPGGGGSTGNIASMSKTNSLEVPGWQATAIKNPATIPLRRTIEDAKEQDLGFLAADEGATVRWTDSNEFAFQRTFDHGVVVCNRFGNRNTEGHTNYEVVGCDASGYVGSTNAQPQFQPTCSDIGLVQPPFLDYLELGTLHNCDGAIVGGTTFYKGLYDSVLTPAYTTATSFTLSGHYYYMADNAALQPLQPIAEADYFRSADRQFNKGLYADINGLTSDQVLTVQVVWHVEYTPKNSEAWKHTMSPVDLDFDAVSALVRDFRAFPVVTKGHSFFSSLKAGLARALGFADKIYTRAAPIAQAMLAAVPDPRAQAASMGIGALGSALDSIKRARFG